MSAPQIVRDDSIAGAPLAPDLLLGDLAGGGANAHLTVTAIGLLALDRRIGSVEQNPAAGVLQSHLVFLPGRPQSVPVRLVNDDDETTAAANGLMSSDFLDLDPPRGRKHILSLHAIEGEFGKQCV